MAEGTRVSVALPAASSSALNASRMSDSSFSLLPENVAGFFRGHGIRPGALLLVAFSGGADSTALLAACVEAGFRCRALHCNFQLRGDESMRDEQFARNMASRLGCEIEVVRFDVEGRRAVTGESVEMACRWLRYDWFARMFDMACERGENPACVAVGHHAADNVETFFLNALRGSGLKGMGAISSRRDIYMRPLLHADKNDILGYLSRRGLVYVTDSSNLSDCYSRNKLRNQVIPVLSEAFPDAARGIERTIGNLRRDYDLLASLIDNARRCCVEADGSVRLDEVVSRPCSSTLLFHLLDGQLPLSVVENVLKAYARGESGRKFGCGLNDFLLDRGRLVRVDGFSRQDKPEIRGEVLDVEDFRPERRNDVIWLDGEAASLPLSGWRLRRWRHGDRLKPFGMKGSKLVSDLLSDLKIPLNEKENCWVLCCGDEIVWVVGVRASRLFPVTGQSQTVIRLQVVSVSDVERGQRVADVRPNEA